jgi:hypothetical protein
MPTLRNLIDRKDVSATAKDDVFNHLKNVAHKKADFDVAKVKLHSKLAPTRQLLDHVAQNYALDVPGGMGGDPNQQDDLARTGQMQRPQAGRGTPATRPTGSGSNESK